MKKIYMIPTTDVVNVELQQMMAGSIETPVDDVNTQSNESALSRGYSSRSLWDDEDEEEY